MECVMRCPYLWPQGILLSLKGILLSLKGILLSLGIKGEVIFHANSLSWGTVYELCHISAELYDGFEMWVDVPLRLCFNQIHFNNNLKKESWSSKTKRQYFIGNRRPNACDNTYQILKINLEVNVISSPLLKVGLSNFLKRIGPTVQYICFTTLWISHLDNILVILSFIVLDILILWHLLVKATIFHQNHIKNNFILLTQQKAKENCGQ